MVLAWWIVQDLFFGTWWNPESAHIGSDQMHINIPKPNQRPDLVIFPLLEIMPRMILKSTWYEIKSKPKPNNSRSRSTDHRPENYASTQQGIRWISWDWFRLQIWSLLQLMMKASVWEMVWLHWLQEMEEVVWWRHHMCWWLF